MVWPPTAQPATSLGDDVEIVVNTYDESNTTISARRIVRRIRSKGAAGVICLVGVQSNQFPRALDLAREFRQAGLPVIIGGFHVSGSLRMLPQMPSELQEAQALGVSLFAGEAEGRMDALLADAYHGRLKAVYNYLDDLPDLRGQPVPLLPEKTIRRTIARWPRSTPAAAAPSSASSARSSTSRGENPARAVPTTLSGSSAGTTLAAWTISSSPTTTSPATRMGSRSPID